MSLELKAVGFSYLPGTPMSVKVLEAVDFELRPGEVVCLMGSTGAGKSTLLQLMCGLLPPTRGEVILDGATQGRSRAGMMALCRAAGILMQSPERQLFAETLERDVSFGPRNQGLVGEELAGRAREALAAVGLEPDAYAARSPFSLSGGEMRRAALAGVLAMRPSYLLLDEPSAGLDLPGRELLYAILERLREEGRGVLLVTHDWEEVEAVGDRVAVLAAGRLAVCGGVGEVLASWEGWEEAGLRPPPLAEVLRGLRRRGLDLPSCAVSPEEAARIIAAAVGGGGI